MKKLRKIVKYFQSVLILKRTPRTPSDTPLKDDGSSKDVLLNEINSTTKSMGMLFKV